jgi:hypothetical protein
MSPDRSVPEDAQEAIKRNRLPLILFIIGIGGTSMVRAWMVGTGALLVTVLVMIVTAAVLVPLMIRTERRRINRAPTGTLFGGTGIVPLHDALPAHLQEQVFGTANLRRISLLAMGRPSGTLLIDGKGLAWEPDRSSKRWGIRPFTVSWDAVRVADVAGFAAKAALRLSLREGDAVLVETNRPERLREALRQAGIRLKGEG